MTWHSPGSHFHSSCSFLISYTSSLGSSQTHLCSQHITVLWTSYKYLKFNMSKLTSSFPALHKSDPLVFSLKSLLSFWLPNYKSASCPLPCPFLYLQLPPGTSSSSLSVDCISLSSSPLSICTLIVIITTCTIRALGCKRWKLIPVIISRRIYWKRIG